MNATPASAVLVFGLVIVNVSVDVPPATMGFGAKDLVREGAVRTITEALDVLPVPPLVEDTVTLLFFVPVVLPNTFTEKVHDPPVASVAPARLTVEEPAVAVIVPPPQLPVSPFGVATTRPDGKVSVKATSLSVAPVFG